MVDLMYLFFARAYLGSSTVSHQSLLHISSPPPFLSPSLPLSLSPALPLPPSQVQRKEILAFLDFAHDYFKHLSDAFESGNPTCLAKILGLYQVRVRGRRAEQ